MNQQQKDYFYSKSFTLKGRIFYPQLFTPKVSKLNPNGPEKYSVVFAWAIADASQTAATQEIGQFLGTAKANFFPQIPDTNFIKPIKKWGEYQKTDGKPLQSFYEGMYWMNLSANAAFTPQVVDEQRQPVIDEAQVYSGRNALVNFSFYAYSTGNIGIAANVKAVLLLEGGDKEAGSGGVDVNAAFGGFASAMNTNAAAAAESTAKAMPAQQAQSGGFI